MRNFNQKHPVNSSEVNIEAIMSQVREKIQQNRRTALKQGLKSRQFVFDDYPEEPTSGDYDYDLYAQLRQVNQPHRILGVRRTPRVSWLSKLPIAGAIWRQIQRAGHDLVIFYVNSLAGEVVAFQRHVAGVLNRLVSWSQVKDEELRLLQAEIKALRERIDLLEAKQ